MTFALNQYAIADLLSPAALTGTVTCTSGSATAVGAGTLFLTELSVNDVVLINGQYSVVAVVTDNTHFNRYGSGYTFTASGMAATRYPWLVFGAGTYAGCPPPKGVHIPYTKPLKLGNGMLRGGGWIGAEWHWGFLSQASRELLRFSCGGTGAASAAMVVAHRRYDTQDAYQVYSGVGLWPVAEDRQTGRRITFTLPLQAMLNVMA